MPTYEVNGRSYAVDEDGFLENPEIWNEDVAKDFAASEGVEELTSEYFATGSLEHASCRLIVEGDPKLFVEDEEGIADTVEDGLVPPGVTFTLSSAGLALQRRLE